MKNSKLFLPFYFLFFTCLSFAQTLAPGAPGKDAQWATAGKQGVGTSANLESKVWFTLAQGVMTEVYYPDVTVANVHLLQFVVVNPKTKKVETEQDDAIHEVKVLRPDSLTFQQINTAKTGEWKITKTYTTDPDMLAVVMIDVQFESKINDLNLYYYYDPSIANSGMSDTAYSRKDDAISYDGKFYSSLLISTGTEEKTNGFYQESDGLEQLKKDGKIINSYDEAKNGNVVQMAKIKNPKKFTLVLSFADNEAGAFVLAVMSKQKGFQKTLAEYEKGWSEYVKTLPKIEPKYQAQFNMAAMILKAHEDKIRRGANIASLSVPWGGGANANENNIGGYHLVWSRDLYQVATAFIALGDTAAANRALDFLFDVQQKADGSFPQNSYLDGKPFWGSLQLDEVAFPLILAYQLKRFDKSVWENHIKRAADFIVKTGPKTPQERWEEKSGYSPSTIAAEIAGLVCAAEIARKNGDETSANLYLKTADDWAANVEKWTATTNGKYGDGNYYIRLTENGTPDAKEKTVLNNGAGTFIENEIVDAGFLELVRLGIKSPDDPLIVKSLKVVDQVIRVNTPNGEAFYRYNHDGYGEMDDGRRWNWDGKYTGKGRLWALLSGERGQYELARFNSFKFKDTKGLSIRQQNNNYKNDVFEQQRWKKTANSRLDAMLGFANEGLMIPEQIWDSPNVPKDADKQFIPELKFGEGTGSATPLAWSMAQFIRLAVNLQAGKNIDMPDVVYERYVLGKKSKNTNPKSAEESDDPGDLDIAEIPTNFESDKRCSDMSSYKKDCSYTSILAKENTQNPQITKCRISGFYLGCKDSLKEMHACFNYKGEFKTLEIAGDFTNWKPVALRNSKKKDGNWIDCFNFAKDARVEYKLIVDGKWILDSLNPNKVDNGVGGENSVFTMPEYKPTVWDKNIGGFQPTLEEFEIDSKNFGRRTIKVYLPRDYSRAKLTAYPTLYIQDGTDYFTRAKAAVQMENLVSAGKINSFIIVFIDPKDRMKEYWANDNWADFVANEVVPAVDKKYTTIQKRENRALLGASLGGITSFQIALKHPEIFSRIGGQSASFWIDDERVVKELETLDASKNNFTFYIDDGTLEGVEDSRKVVKILKDKNFNVVYNEAEAGHNWTSWRDRLADAFVALWKN